MGVTHGDGCSRGMGVHTIVPYAGCRPSQCGELVVSSIAALRPRADGIAARPGRTSPDGSRAPSRVTTRSVPAS